MPPPLRNVLDVGAYYNPINLFFGASHCPASVVVIEPILDALSAIVPCPGSPPSTRRTTPDTAPPDATHATHFIVLPITFKFYVGVKHLLPKPERCV